MGLRNPPPLDSKLDNTKNFLSEIASSQHQVCPSLATGRGGYTRTPRSGLGDRTNFWPIFWAEQRSYPKKLSPPNFLSNEKNFKRIAPNIAIHLLFPYRKLVFTSDFEGLPNMSVVSALKGDLPQQARSLVSQHLLAAFPQAGFTSSGWSYKVHAHCPI
jgi:hypothetical protein